MSEGRTDVLDGAIAPSENTALFGHLEAQDFLATGYRSGKGHHAILIEGPQGIGKATLAFRFANHVLSYPEPETAPAFLSDPDAASIVSRQLAAGSSHNLLHLARPIDEKTGKMKSAITVDEVRRAGRFFSQTSGTGNWRIVVIDPADDLNRNAANAILKILEEPPKRSMFLVLSHAPGRLLPTIRSRCLPLVLRPLDDAEIRSALQHLGVALPADHAPRIMAAARGSVSEALKLVNYGGLDIIDTFDQILAATEDAPARRRMHKLADVLSAKESETIFDFFTTLVTRHVTTEAKRAGLAADLPAAERLARLSSELAERITVADAYNLDRKQTVMSILGDLRSARTA